MSRAGVDNFGHPGNMCGATCQRECMIHLEKQDKLTNKFHTPFRIRKPFRLNPEELLKEKFENDNKGNITDYGQHEKE